MGLKKSILEVLSKNESVQKAENPHSYAKNATTGLLLGYPVKIKGEDKRHDNKIKYHSSIKFFDKEKETPNEAHAAASKLDMSAPNPKEVGIETGKIKGRDGSDVYVIKLHGKHADKLKEHHNKLSGMGHKENYEFHPHISVPKSVHDDIKASGAKTAHEAGIEFDHAELKHGDKTLATYKPKTDRLAASEDIHNNAPLMKPYVSEAQRRWAHTTNGKKALGGNAGVHEWDEATKGKKLPERVKHSGNTLEKGTLKNILTAGAMAGALASPSNANAKPPHQATNRSPASLSSKQHTGYSHDRMLNAISQIESSGGKNINHKPTSAGTAYGKWALMPNTIKETIKLNPKLRREHSKILNLQNKDLNRYMQDNPKLERELASTHLKRLEHHFGNNSNAIAFSWNQGITGTNRALNEKKDITSHPYVQKFKHFYEGKK